MTDFKKQVFDYFSNDGLLSESPDFEFRIQQQNMAEEIAKAFETERHKIIEAPTGIGKTYAYLVPSIIHAKSKKLKAVISTRTINLQEQIIKKDIPALRGILPFEFTSHILKGRSNYICTKRLSRAMTNSAAMFDNEQSKILRKIYNLVHKHDKGELQDFDFSRSDPSFKEVWSAIYAEQDVCTRKSCGGDEPTCFFQRAKKNAENADIIILNHSLFFTLFGINEKKGSGYLYANDFVIFDEAHTIEQIAADNVADEVSREQISFWLRRLYNPKNGKGFYDERRNLGVINEIRKVESANEQFFFLLMNQVYEKYKNTHGKNEIRIRDRFDDFSDIQRCLNDVINEINKSKSLAKNDDEENEIRNFSRRFAEIRRTIDDFMNQSKDEYVYWIEASQGRKRNIKLRMSPIDMADYFRKNIFVPERYCVMTSATLSINDKMSFFKNSIGADNIESFILDSAFDYERQMKIIIDEQMQLPEKNAAKEVSELFESTEYEKALREKILDYIGQTNGGVLVLFTNYRMMNQVGLFLKEKLIDSGITIFIQGQQTSSNELLEKFKEDENSILLGVDSFWMGVDVPGESLRNVIITKLPFETPDNPIIEAKLELIEKRGGNPFMDYSLPTAILKFKQGIGRLIRNKTDEGRVVVLDKRILTARYGKHFINALPHQNIILQGQEYEN